jgi:hypothetical protein
MNMISQLIYPNVDLYLYDLREGLREDSEQVALNRKKFWQKIYANLDDKQLNDFATAESNYDEFVQLLPNVTEDFEKSPYAGFLYPTQLKIDTYALQVDCSIKDAGNNGQKSYTSEPISIFQLMADEINSRIDNQHGALGETWLIWGQLPKIHKDPEEIAKECYQELSQNGTWDVDFQGQGKLSGATLFELWQTQRKSDKDKNGYHLLILLFPSKDSIESITECIKAIHEDLIHLFSFRNKIVWVSNYSNNLKVELKKKFKEVQKMIDAFKQMNMQLKSQQNNLSQLQEYLTQSLVILSEYTNLLSLLNSQSLTIRVNLLNYQNRLEKIKQKNSNSDIDFLMKFANEFAAKNQTQIEMDYANLSHGLTLIENLISTIKGTVEIYQANRDRSLNNTIAIAGIGLATSQIASSVIVAQYPPEKGEFFLHTPAFAWSLLTGVTASILFSSLLWLIFRLQRRL